MTGDVYEFDYKGQRGHHRLRAWQEAMSLVKQVYRLTSDFPREEVYGLTAQMRRAAVSVPSNIAEGAARTGKKEFLQFLSVARGSLSELETQVILATELGFIKDGDELTDRIGDVFRLVGGLMRSLQSDGKA